MEQEWYTQLKRLQDEPVTENELQKVKNQVAADSYRGLQANFRLLVGMAYSEALGGWEEINESPKKLQAVTAADIQRVARKYFDVSNRSVATFMRNATAASGADAGQEDPEIAKLPAPMQARAKQMVAQLMKETDLKGLQEGITQMEAQAAQVPPQMKPMIDFMLSKMRQRISQLETAGGAK